MPLNDSSPESDAMVTEVAAPPPAPGGRFGRYEVLRRPDGALHELGRGAMGVTYKASDSKLRRTVALKVINASLLGSDPFARQRFQREASAAAQLHHPHIATVFDIGEEGQDEFYVMEFIEGEDLLTRCRRNGPMDVNAGLRVAHQVAQALGAAWQQRVVHRDIKPANLMLASRSGAAERLVVKVVDFGLAKALDAGVEGSALISRAATFMGTAAYASPEQIEGGELDIRSDLYSLGITLWHLLTGQPTFGNTSMQQAITGHLAKRPPFSDLRAVGVPEPVIALMGRLLEKSPEDRQATPDVLLEEIEQIERQPGGGVISTSAVTAVGAPNFSRPPEDSFPTVALGTGALAGARDGEALATLSLQAPPAAFPLMEVLRQRGALRAGEIARLAGAFPALVAASRRVDGGAFWELTPQTVHVHFAVPPPDLAKLPSTPVEAWPPFTVGLYSNAGAAETMNAGQTFLPATRPTGGAEGLQGQLAALIYELLSGAAPRTPYSPLAALNEESNAVLRRALTPPGFGSAEEFTRAFQSALDGTAQPLKVEAAMKSLPAQSWASMPTAVPPMADAEVEERLPLVWRLAGKVLLSLIVSLALAKGMVWWKSAPRRLQPPVVAAAPVIAPPVVQAAAPLSTPPPRPTRVPTPTPTPIPAPPPTPPPPGQFPPPNFDPAHPPPYPPPPGGPFFQPPPRRPGR